MKPINRTPVLKQYPGQWVAFKKDQVTVAAAAKTAKTAFEKARHVGVKVPILMKVPIESLPYVGQFSVNEISLSRI